MPEPPDDRKADEVDWGDEIRRFLPVALRIAIRLCGNQNTAEDLVQDALLKIAKARENFRGDCQVQTWMNRILINVGRDWIRSRVKQNASMSLMQSDVTSRSTASEIEQKETAIEVWQAISSLPERQREVVTLSVWQQMPATEIAGVLQINVQNVYSNLSAAKQQLRDVLRPRLLE